MRVITRHEMPGPDAMFAEPNGRWRNPQTEAETVARHPRQKGFVSTNSFDPKNGEVATTTVIFSWDETRSLRSQWGARDVARTSL